MSYFYKKTCETCGKDFKSASKKQKACSMACSWKRRKLTTKYAADKECTFEGCGIHQYAKGYCTKHYNQMLKTGSPIPKFERGARVECVCEVCGKKSKTTPSRTKKYCSSKCFREIRKKLMLGKKNPRWSGGASGYKNHPLFKENRLKKIEQSNGLCENCGNKGREVHHKDESRSNHSIKNLIVLCYKCHGIYHHGRKNKKRRKMTHKRTRGGDLSWLVL